MVEQGREQIQPLEEIAERAQKQASGELLFIGIAVALWSVSALANTLADAFNTTYGLTETRRWWKAQALSLASGPIVAVVVIVALVSLVTGSRVTESVAEAFGLRELYVFLLAWLHYPVALVLLWAALSVVYRYSPAVTQPLRSVVLGAALAVVAWAITTVGFSYYLAKFADFGVTYGSLGAAVGLLVYLNLSASIVLAGAELNAAMRPSAAPERAGARADGMRGTDRAGGDQEEDEEAARPGSPWPEIMAGKPNNWRSLWKKGDKKRVAIACQGGGSHTAFTAGVLKRLLRTEELKGHEVVGLSGTSGGAVCALLAWHYLLKGDAAGAAQALDAFWRDNSASAPHEQIANYWTVWASNLQNFVAVPTVSPYDNYFSVVGLNEFRRMLERRVDFGEVGVQPEGSYPMLLVGAVDVLSGEFRAFNSRRDRISPETILASAAIPTLFRSVRLETGGLTGTASSRRTLRSGS